MQSRRSFAPTRPQGFTSGQRRKAAQVKGKWGYWFG